jgi:hypothetical protein
MNDSLTLKKGGIIKTKYDFEWPEINRMLFSGKIILNTNH